MHFCMKYVTVFLINKANLANSFSPFNIPYLSKSTSQIPHYCATAIYEHIWACAFL